MPLKLNAFSKALSFFLLPSAVSVLFPVMTHGRCEEELGMPVSAYSSLEGPGRKG